MTYSKDAYDKASVQAAEQYKLARAYTDRKTAEAKIQYAPQLEYARI